MGCALLWPREHLDSAKAIAVDGQAMSYVTGESFGSYAHSQV